MKGKIAIVVGFLAALILYWTITGRAQVSGAEYTVGSTNLTATVQQYISLIPSEALAAGINFGTIYSGTTGNPALNNSNGVDGGTAYNITVDSSTTVSVNFWHKLESDLPCAGGTCTVRASASKTNATHGFSTNETVETTWKVIGNSTVNCTDVSPGGNCWIKYYLDVSSGVVSGTYQTTYWYCGNATTGTATCG